MALLLASRVRAVCTVAAIGALAVAGVGFNASAASAEPTGTSSGSGGTSSGSGGTSSGSGGTSSGSSGSGSGGSSSGGSGTGTGPGTGSGTSTTGLTARLIEGSTLTVARGSQLTVTGEGFTPQGEAKVWFHSDPILVATATVAADGTVTATFLVPSAAAAGVHTIEIEDVSTGRVFVVATVTITDQATLAQTGFAGDLAGGAGALLLLAGAGVLVSRRVGRGTLSAASPKA
ncbi:hypothetical protein ITJ38_00825 [Agreia pratensis]|uniref:IPT/TIG domain-containing protein n=1 Tax=Agreia pratensis TaxID=150121 RepID=A0A1X7IPC1_9MICO|nr:hypothetical protein [Agreia pratensis]MBF4632942.1 hypothetical protein [Agreia pratensis]SMG16874.1 hypothetical protein SAMN06296010_0753 [Agreia pratensis]